MHFDLRALLTLLALGTSGQAAATFSISACDAQGNCGAAIATNNLAVGATTLYARAGVGVVVTQFETNPSYGPRGLELLAAAHDAKATLAELLAGDGRFEGLDTAYRQVAVIDRRGHVAIFTGAQASAQAWAGGRQAADCAIIGNGLVSAEVLAAMEQAFHAAGSLPERLMAALEAGQRAGGQATGAMSAALLVRTPQGGFADIDLRVDADPAPVPALRRLLDLERAHEAMLAAERAAQRGSAGDADANLATALRLGGSWDRIWRRAARLAMSRGQPDHAIDALARFLALNPAWARRELDDPLYAPLRERAEFKQWRAAN